MIYDPRTANPMAGNPFRKRADVARALNDLFAPLLPHFSTGGARVRLDAAAAHFDRAAADLEGFARPLWGLVPLAAGGGAFAHWDLYRRGIANGSDPEHPEYWGTVQSTDQRMLELAAIGFGLGLIPHILWEPLEPTAKESLAAYLLHARRFEYANNNWKFFRVLVDLGLMRVGVAYERSLTDRYLDELDGFYLADGWYRDGNVRRLDHYVPFAMHFYGLIYARLSGAEVRNARYRERARLFARDIRHWYAEDGAALAFGRSLTYRFACAGFWAALAFAGEEALPWGEIKGYYLRHLRWWADRPIAHRDRVLSIGYGYPNLIMSEHYNSAGSPYWAFKAFLPLALPEDHPFWAAEEVAAEPARTPVPLRHPGMVMMATKGNVIALSSGQENIETRFGSEKYAKFVYSSRYAFSIESDERNFAAGVFDGMLAFSDDGIHYRVREGNGVALIAGTTLYARWHPWADVTVETWLLPAAPWHLRIHRITTPRPLATIEGGFAIPRRDGAADRFEEKQGAAAVWGAADFSGTRDLGSSIVRAGRAHKAPPNTNLIVAKTTVPQLMGEVPTGENVLVTAVVALPLEADPHAAWRAPPAPPDLDALAAEIHARGVRVSAIEGAVVR
jgi:hypothetical protein